MRTAARTELGHVRRRNEDALLVLESAGVLVVADGLGGHPCGDLASQTAVESLRSSLQDGPDEGADSERWLRDAIDAAHGAVVAEAAVDRERTGMATTVVVAQVVEGSAWVAHVGDSRAYLLTRDELRPVTEDHARGGYITQALGLDRAVSPDAVRLHLSPGDRLLLCTDGLTNMVDEPEIARLLGDGDVSVACDALVDAALDAGGVDNVTVVVAEG